METAEKDMRLIMSKLFISLDLQDYSEKVLTCRKGELSSLARLAIKVLVVSGKHERALLVLTDLNKRFENLHFDEQLPYVNLMS